MGLNKKGIYHIMDAIFASILLLGALLFLINSPLYDSNIEQKSYLSQDMLTVLGEIKLSELNHPFVTQEINDGNITDINKTVLQKAGEYWALNETSKAQTLIEIVLNGSLPRNTNFRLSIEGEELLKSGSNSGENIAASSRMISGIESGKPITGSSAAAYLKKIRNKKTSSFTYYGGFVGQGNITTMTDTLPSDINTSKINEIIIEGDFNENFTLKINDEVCNSSGSITQFTPLTSSGEIEKWDITSCANGIIPGKNNISIYFLGEINSNYIAGGLVKIDYRTDELQQNLSYGKSIYNFPEIIGVANLYDSFYIPGDLQSMEIGLHFKSDQQTYLTVGERIIEMNTTGSDQWTILSNTDLLNNYSFDYDLLSQNTVPLRFAAYNSTVEEIITGDADIVLITDFSGSMKKAVDSWDSQGTGITDCETLYTYPDARKTHLAKCLDNVLVETVMNYSGNRLWPVFLHDNEIKSYDNPNDKLAIQGYIDSFGPQGKGETCLACAVNKAYEILEQYSNENRSKFIVLMSDGSPTHCADGSCISTSSTYGAEQCVGFCDTSGASGCQASEKTGCDLSDLQCEPAEDNTIFSVDRAYNDLNASFFTIGFGLIDECDRTFNLLTDIADSTNGTYQYSKNTTDLLLIYENISSEILTRITQENQFVSVQGNISSSELYLDSYINYTFNPISPIPNPGKISIVLNEPLTNCTSNIVIPPEIDVVDAKVTSYSGIHWSDLLVVNSETVFNLSNYYVPYYRLGDPLIIQVPVDKIQTGNNTLFIDTGDSAINRTGCSDNNTFIYTALLNASTPRTNTFEIIDGCTWTVESENNNNETVKIPKDYAGSNTCEYTSTNISYNSLDAYDVAAYALFTQLDPDDNGKIIVELTATDLEITLTIISNIPYLWGPTLLKSEVWQ